MKKILAFFFLLSFASLAYPADFKIIGGLSLSKSTEYMDPGGLPGPSLQAQYRSGFAVGGGVEFSLARNLALEVDAIFNQKGTRIRLQENDDPPVYWMVRINELSIPVLAKVRLKPGTSPYILAGGELAFVLTDAAKSVDYGLVGGIGFRKQLNKIGMSLEARYHHGLHDLQPEPIYDPLDDVPTYSRSRKMRVLVFMLGFSI
jgi:opacity protein-like surface antigen